MAGWDCEADVVIVGSGAAALAAAVAVVNEGKTVLMYEAAAQPGGTTALSGGAFWIPNNALMRAAGRTDPREDAIKLMARLSYPSLYDPEAVNVGLPQRQYDLIAAYYDNASPIIELMTQLGALHPYIYPQFGFSPDPLSDPDYFSDLPENAAPYGRVLGNAPPNVVGWPGYMLTQGIIEWLENEGVTISTNSRVVSVVQKNSGEVVGVVIDHLGFTIRAKAKRGVIFATGGFAHSASKMIGLSRGPLFGTGSVPTTRGDFLDIAASLGASVDNLANAFYFQLAIERAAAQNGLVGLDGICWQAYGDSSIIVNKTGKRCQNEKLPYHVRGQTHFHTLGTDEPNLVQIMIWDDAVAQEPTPWPWRSLVPMPGPLPSHIITANTLGGLAAQIQARLDALRGQRFFAAGVVPNVQLDPNFVTNLQDTIARFNGFAASGVDLDFQRGATAFENAWQGPSRSVTANRTMYPMSAAGPYYAVLLGAGTLDTCGGPVTAVDGHVLRPNGAPIPGLFGAGNCVASPAGRGYWGAGGTIGPALVFGFLAGIGAANEPKHPA
ncbi:MAG: FAD-dependent oxidoreductase [Polyangiaceae bacterium]|nr:FAD-dependent oxidoreductase [Polyangiaceae bacterium]